MTPNAQYRWIHFLGDELPEDDRQARRWLGGKAHSLDRLRRAGLPVPPAFVITSEVCRQYHTANRQWPADLWKEVHAGMARLEAITGKQFGRGPQPLTVAVRSGASQSMPGLLATILHCGITESLARQIDEQPLWEAFAEFLESYVPVVLGRTAASDISGDRTLPATKRCETWLERWRVATGGSLPDSPQEMLEAAVTAVVDSWQSDECRRYRARYAADTDDATAVTLQVIFSAELSGVVFSRRPDFSSGGEMVVEAGRGLGRRLVGGQIVPWRWSVDRETLQVSASFLPDSDPSAAAASTFTQKALERLARDVLAIESIFGEPVDVEFGYAAGEIVFFQARPIEDQVVKDAVGAVRAIERERVLDWARRGRRLWVRHNLAESLPAPTPLSWELWRAFMTGAGGLGHVYRRLGYRPSRRVCREGFIELIAGRIYADPHRLTEMFCAGYPFRFDADALRHDAAALDRPPTRLDLEQLDPWFLLRWPWIGLLATRAQRRRQVLAATAEERFNSQVLTRFRSWLEKERRVVLGGLSLRQLIELFQARRRTIFDELGPETLLPGALGAAAWCSFEQQLRKHIGDERSRETAGVILAEIVDPITSRRQLLLQQVAEGRTPLEVFLDEFGHRGPGEMDLSSPTWRHNPNTVLTLAKRVGYDPRRDASDEPPPSQRALQLLREAGVSQNARLADSLRHALQLLPYREIGKHELLRAYDLLRDLLSELARRTGLKHDIHYLTIGEIESLSEADNLIASIERRRQHHQACRRLYLPSVLQVDDELSDFGTPPRVDGGAAMSGVSLSRGQASGRAWVLRDGEFDVELARDRIVVTSSLTASGVLELADAAALVVEQAGTLSHVAILTRQLLLPAVAVAEATRQIRDGELIYLDADRGTITRIEP